MGERAARSTAVGFAAATCVMAVAALLLARGPDGVGGVPYAVLPPQEVLAAPVYALTGVALVWMRHRNAVGWILLAIGLCGITGMFLGAYGVRAYVSPDSALPAGDFALSMASWLWLPAVFLLPTLLPLLYPSGELPSPRWRLAVLSTGAGLIALALVAAFSTDSVSEWYSGARPPWVLPSALQVTLAIFGIAVLAGTSIACIGNAATRLWRAEMPERAQLAWLLAAAGTAAALAVFTPADWVLAVALAVPLAVAVGILRYGLLGIEPLLRSTLLYGLLALGVALVFAGITTALSALFEGPLPIFAAATVVAVGLVPAHTRLREFVARLLDGPSADPLEAMTGLSRVVAGSGGTAPVQAVLASVAESVGSSYVALRDGRGVVVASHPVDTVGAPLRLDVIPIGYDGQQQGTLEVASPPRGFSETGQAWLRALAPLVGMVARSTQLNAELEEARLRLVTAAQTERARLRRDLHDGLGPSLSGVSLGLEAVRRALRGDPDRAGEILDRAQAEVRSAVDEVHRILDGLRPSVLDELGLVGALRAQAHDPAGDLDFEVVAAADLSALEPEVEIAAYHIALEAVTNARRHAGATRCTVQLDRAQGQVHVEIRDDGHGLPSQPRQGIGLASMRHRAESLGGLLTVQSGPAGTRVVADIPRQRS